MKVTLREGFSENVVSNIFGQCIKIVGYFFYLNCGPLWNNIDMVTKNNISQERVENSVSAIYKGRFFYDGQLAWAIRIRQTVP